MVYRGGKQIESNEIGAIDENNNELSLIPSTLGINQNLEGPISPTELLDLSVTTVYSILPDEISKDLENSLDKGEIWKCNFNFRADYRMETCFILKMILDISLLLEFQITLICYLQTLCLLRMKRVMKMTN